jgi:DNA mismatch repair protein MutL
LIPLTFELSPQQSESLRALLPEFARLGFDIEPFGPRSWAVHALPADLPEFDPIPLLIEMIDDFEESRRINALEDLRDRVLIRTACHSAIRAGQHLSKQTMVELLRQIRAEKLSLTCPHGRPTIVRLGKAELDRQFKRIV